MLKEQMTPSDWVENFLHSNTFSLSDKVTYNRFRRQITDTENLQSASLSILEAKLLEILILNPQTSFHGENLRPLLYPDDPFITPDDGRVWRHIQKLKLKFNNLDLDPNQFFSTGHLNTAYKWAGLSGLNLPYPQPEMITTDGFQYNFFHRAISLPKTHKVCRLTSEGHTTQLVEVLIHKPNTVVDSEQLADLIYGFTDYHSIKTIKNIWVLKSRTSAALDRIYPGLGNHIVTGSGGYKWSLS